MDPIVIDNSVVIAQLGLIEVIGCAVITGIFGVVMKWQEKRRNKEREDDLEYRKMREEEEARYKAELLAKEKARKELDTARLNLSFATANGLMVLLHAAHGDQVNGNVDKAIESIDKAKGECNALTNKNAIEHVS